MIKKLFHKYFLCAFDIHFYGDSYEKRCEYCGKTRAAQEVGAVV